MKNAVLVIACALVIGSLHLSAQSSASSSTARDLIGTWTLVSTDQGVDAGKPAMVPNARGLLIFDGGGHVFEVITRGTGRGAGAAPAPADPVTTFKQLQRILGRLHGGRERQKFAGGEPTEAEARTAFMGYVGYFGALGVYPGMVFHQILAGAGSLQGSTLKRFYELKGTDLNIRFPPGTNQQGQQTTTLVTLRRLSGEREMLR
jgi:hypothetical protein